MAVKVADLCKCNCPPAKSHSNTPKLLTYPSVTIIVEAKVVTDFVRVQIRRTLNLEGRIRRALT
jgi:hypothetical protein